VSDTNDIKKLTRTEFDALPPLEKNRVMKEGYRIVNDMTVREFGKLDSRERAQFEREGGVIVPDPQF
jgi:hypothetical protein